MTRALELDGDELEMLAAQIESSLRERKSAHDEAWSAELKRRLERLDSSEAKVYEWDEAERLIFED